MPKAREPAMGRTPAEQLLCAVARGAAGLPVPELRPSAALDGVDWGMVPHGLRRHGLQALGAALLAPARERMPAPVWAAIARDALDARTAALGMFAELRRIIDELRGLGVDAMTYKGSVMAWDAYGDLGARPFVDLDLLVRPADADRALAVLDAAGYARVVHDTPARDAWFRRVDGDYQLVHRDSGLLVELHVRAMSRRFGPGLETDALWRRRRAVAVAGTELAAPADDDALFLHLVHGAKHRWERLEWVAATAALLRRVEGDVSPLLREPYRAPRAVLLGAWIAHEIAGAPLAPATRSAIARDPAVAPLTAAVRAHLFAPSPTDDRDETAAKLAFNLRVQRGVTARARFIYRWLAWPSPEDWSEVSLPDWIFGAYRLLRPLRLARRYAARPARPAHG
ncbi:MAG TPA: nucleotidyltransferase family protein [Gemmatimonadaceae bacterium]|nr:nucleotidyltransferase family protein [Gemmatimonadaceae bacterium]